MNAEEGSFLPDFCTKQTLILGCGNRLFGDDGLGPAVIDYLFAHYEIPDDVYVMDVGTGVRKLLFTLSLSETRPRRILIIDAVDKGRSPGEIFEIPLEDVPIEKVDDFSLHQVPSSNLMKELKEVGVDVCVMVCQVACIPTSVRPGLSEAVQQAVPEMSELIANNYLHGRESVSHLAPRVL
jgi:coenzyme F420 hydrogenase subunit delta